MKIIFCFSKQFFVVIPLLRPWNPVVFGLLLLESVKEEGRFCCFYQINEEEL